MSPAAGAENLRPRGGGAARPRGPDRHAREGQGRRHRRRAGRSAEGHPRDRAGALRDEGRPGRQGADTVDAGAGRRARRAAASGFGAPAHGSRGALAGHAARRLSRPGAADRGLVGEPETGRHRRRARSTSGVPLARASAVRRRDEAAMEGRGRADPSGSLGEWTSRGPWALASMHVEAGRACGDDAPLRRDLTVVTGTFPSQSLKVDPAYVEVPPESELDRIREDREKVAHVWEVPAQPRRLGAGRFNRRWLRRSGTTSDASGSSTESPVRAHDGVDHRGASRRAGDRSGSGCRGAGGGALLLGRHGDPRPRRGPLHELLPSARGSTWRPEKQSRRRQDRWLSGRRVGPPGPTCTGALGSTAHASTRSICCSYRIGRLRRVQVA